MRRNEVLKRIHAAEGELRERFGVRSLALFGSVARDEATDASDVDLLVEFDRPIGYFHVFRTEDFLEEKLGGIKVDLVLRNAVIEELKEDIYGEAIEIVQ
jgi:uncharacterized protein